MTGERESTGREREDGGKEQERRGREPGMEMGREGGREVQRYYIVINAGESDNSEWKSNTCTAQRFHCLRMW